MFLKHKSKRRREEERDEAFSMTSAAVARRKAAYSIFGKVAEIRVSEKDHAQKQKTGNGMFESTQNSSCS